MKTNILEENIDQNISVHLYGELRTTVWRIAKNTKTTVRHLLVPENDNRNFRLLIEISSIEWHA